MKRRDGVVSTTRQRPCTDAQLYLAKYWCIIRRRVIQLENASPLLRRLPAWRGDELQQSGATRYNWAIRPLIALASPENSSAMPLEKCPIKIVERNYCRLQGRSPQHVFRPGAALRHRLPDRRPFHCLVRHLARPLALKCSYLRSTQDTQHPSS